MKKEGGELKKKMILGADELVEKNGSLEEEVERLKKDLSSKDEKIQQFEEMVATVETMKKEGAELKEKTEAAKKEAKEYKGCSTYDACHEGERGLANF